MKGSESFFTCPFMLYMLVLDDVLEYKIITYIREKRRESNENIFKNGYRCQKKY